MWNRSHYLSTSAAIAVTGIWSRGTRSQLSLPGKTLLVHPLQSCAESSWSSCYRRLQSLFERSLGLHCNCYGTNRRDLRKSDSERVYADLWDLTWAYPSLEQILHMKVAGVRLTVSMLKVSLSSLKLKLKFGVSETKYEDHNLFHVNYQCTF